jgi:hypothetical protein
MEWNEVQKFFGINENEHVLTSPSSLSVLQDIFDSKDAHRLSVLANEIMPHLYMRTGKNQWISFFDTYLMYHEGQVDDLVSRALHDIQYGSISGDNTHQFKYFNNGLIASLISSGKLTYKSLVENLLQDIDGLIAEGAPSIRKMPRAEFSSQKPKILARRDDITKTLNAILSPKEFTPDGLALSIINNTYWLFKSPQSVKDEFAKMVMECYHNYTFGNPGFLPHAGISDFEYVRSFSGLQDTGLSGVVATIHSIPGDEAHIVRLPRSDSLNWEFDIRVSQAISKLKIKGINPALVVPVEREGNLVDGIYAPWVNGYSLRDLFKDNVLGEHFYFEPGTQYEVTDIVNNASQNGLEGVDINTGNVMVSKTRDVEMNGRRVTVLGNPVIIDPGSWATPDVLNDVYKALGSDRVIQDYIAKLKTVYQFLDKQELKK